MSERDLSTLRVLTPEERRAAVATALVLSDVRAARRKQVERHGYDAAHDDLYQDYELERAAAAYALLLPIGTAELWWPWSRSVWKPRSHRENLVRAAALLVAAIEKIDRAEAKENAQNGTACAPPGMVGS